MVGKEDVENVIQSHLAAGDTDAAITAAVKAYGPEILGFLVAATGSHDHAGEAFLMFSEDMVRGVHSYRGDSPFRSWAYAIARNASKRLYRRIPDRANRQVPIAEVTAISRIAAKVRTRTLQHLRTEAKDSIRALRDELDPDDRAMLVLRIDRKLSWREVARAFLDPEPEPSKADIDRMAATLRKRFERVKTQLRELALDRGLISSE